MRSVAHNVLRVPHRPPSQHLLCAFPPWCCRNPVEGPSSIAHSHLRRALHREAERPGTLPSVCSPPTHTHTQTHSKFAQMETNCCPPYLQKRPPLNRSWWWGGGGTSDGAHVIIIHLEKSEHRLFCSEKRHCFLFSRGLHNSQYKAPIPTANKLLKCESSSRERAATSALQIPV